jgi:hypothetical protein
MKKIVYFALIFLFTGNLIAQQRNAAISFESENFDFGKVKESAGPVTHKFEFTNTGSQPLVITKVTPSCSCTVPAWTKDPVMPGAKGFISATYDVKGRIGIFEKTVTVSSNAERATVVLKIAGDVTQSMSEMYPFKIGQVNVRSLYIVMPLVNKGEIKKTSTEIYNSSPEPVQLTFSDIPAHLKLTANPVSIAPGEVGHIDIAFDSNKDVNYGTVMDRFRVYINGKKEGNYWLSMTSRVVEDFSKLTVDQIKDAPVANFENTSYDFGNIKSGATLKHEFTFKNTGKSDLLLRNISASCSCTAVAPKDRVIKSGSSSTITAIFDSQGKEGYQNKTITVITNDPRNSEVILWIKGTITK